LDKDTHLEFLGDIRCDVSQHMGWRRKLFENPDHTKFEISAESIQDKFPSLAENISTYNLRYVVEKENGDSVDSVVFKFYPLSYPENVKISYNNPEVS